MGTHRDDAMNMRCDTCEHLVRNCVCSKADCGETFEHDGHLFKTERGKVKACDGSITKRVK